MERSWPRIFQNPRFEEVTALQTLNGTAVEQMSGRRLAGKARRVSDGEGPAKGAGDSPVSPGRPPRQRPAGDGWHSVPQGLEQKGASVEVCTQRSGLSK